MPVPYRHPLIFSQWPRAGLASAAIAGFDRRWASVAGVLSFAIVLPLSLGQPPPTARAPDRERALIEARRLIGSHEPRRALDSILIPLASEYPDDPQVHLLAGEAHFALDEFEAAIRAFELGLARAPHFRGKVFNLGRAYQLSGHLDQASQVFAAMVTEDDRDLRTKGHFGLGLVEQARGDDVAAERSFEAALALDPGAHRPLYEIGLLRQRIGQLAKAAVAFENVLALRPLHHGAAYNLALVYARLGEPDKSQRARVLHGNIIAGKKEISSLRDRIAEHPTDPAVPTAIAEVYRRLGSPMEALPWLRRALDLAPSDPSLGLAFADSCRRAGRPAEAERAYQALLARTPPIEAALAPLLELLRARGADAEAQRLAARFGER
ncbi:MAG: tetratricopeptide repeat protein [Planctomycetota bacterium]